MLSFFLIFLMGVCTKLYGRILMFSIRSDVLGWACNMRKPKAWAQAQALRI